MPRITSRPKPTDEQILACERTACPECGRLMHARYNNFRTITTLESVTRFTIRVRRCEYVECPRYRVAYRPEAEGRLALPKSEFGLDVIAAIGSWRYRQQMSVPQMHDQLTERGVAVSLRTVENLLARYDELLAVRLTDERRLKNRLSEQGQVILAIDGLQPDVGHEVLWVIRDCLSGEILLAESLLSGSCADLVPLLRRVSRAVGVPVQGVVSDGQHSIRNAIAEAFPGIPHQLCHFHFLREAARPIWEADRNAKKELKKRVRGVRPIERSISSRDDAEAEVIQGYCDAVRSAITDDGRAPLDASGLKLRNRLQAINESLETVSRKKVSPNN